MKIFFFCKSLKNEFKRHYYLLIFWVSTLLRKKKCNGHFKSVLLETNALNPNILLALIMGTHVTKRCIAWFSVVFYYSSSF